MNDEKLMRFLALESLRYVQDVAKTIEEGINNGFYLTEKAWSEIERFKDRALRTTCCDDLKRLFIPEEEEESACPTKS